MLGAVKFWGDRLAPNHGLRPNEGIVSKNGRVKVVLQTDGNCVLYGDGQPLWWTGVRPGTDLAVMQTDGNFVLYIGGGRPGAQAVWASDTSGHPGAFLVAQDEGNLVLYSGTNALWSSQTNGFHVYGGPGKGPIAQAVDAVESIPVVGGFVHVVGEVYSAPFKVVANIASGERLDQVAVDAFKDQLKIVKDVAPYAQTVVSLVPGLGTGVSMALGAGIALAEGQSITDAAKAAIRSAIPGGPLVVAGFDAALKVASGENVGQVALEAARSQLPPDAQKAFDIGLAVATGEKLQTALVNGLASIAPGQLQTILAAGKNAVLSMPGLSDALKSVTPGAATEGFQYAAGLLAHAGINEKALTAARDALSPEVRQGFDAALKTQEPHIAWLKNVTSAPANPPKMIPRTTATAPALNPPKTINPPQKVATQPALNPPKTITPPKKTVAAYAPYPKKIGLLSAPPHAGHGGHGGGHGGGHYVFRGGRAIPTWGTWDVPFATTDVVTTTGTCRTWGDPIEMPQAMQVSAKVALGASNGQPTTMRSDGVLYLFTLENGVPTARPCSAMGVGALGEAPGRWFYWWIHYQGQTYPYGAVYVTDYDAWRYELEMDPSAELHRFAWNGSQWIRDTRAHPDLMASAPLPSAGGVAGTVGKCFDMQTVTWGPAITGMSGDMERAGRSAVHGTRGRPRAVRGPDGTDYLFSIENGTLTARPAIAV